MFDKIPIRNLDKNAPRFEKNDNGVFLPLHILAGVDSFELISISQISHDMGIEGLYVENQLNDKCDGYITEPNPEPPDDYGQIIHVETTKPKLSPENVTPINIIGVYEERAMQQLSAFRFCKVQMDAALEVFEDMSQQDDLILSQSSKLFLAVPVENDKVPFLNTSIPVSELSNLILKDSKQLKMSKSCNADGIRRADNVFDEWNVLIFCNKNETRLCVLTYENYVLNNNSGRKIDGFHMHVERERTIEGLKCYEMVSETTMGRILVLIRVEQCINSIKSQLEVKVFLDGLGDTCRALVKREMDFDDANQVSSWATGNELPTEVIQTLMKMEPTTEEELKLMLYSWDVSQFCLVERLLKAMVDIPFYFKRLKSLLLMCSFQEEGTLIKATEEYHLCLGLRLSPI